MAKSTFQVNKEAVNRLVTARNHQSQTLVETAQELLRQATEIDLSNLATNILQSYPEAHFIVLCKDQRTGFEGVIFCGHIDDKNGKKIENSFEAKEYVEYAIKQYAFAAPETALERIINLNEYAAKTPSWY